MNTRRSDAPMVALIAVLLAACGSSKAIATIDTYTSPAYASADIESLAILPLRSEHVALPEARALTLSLADSIGLDAPSVRLVDPATAARLMNENDLTGAYVEFVGDFAQTGVADAEYLRSLGRALDVEAIMLGDVIKVQQEEGSTAFLGFGGKKGTTRVSVRFIMLDTGGEVLWEALSDGLRESAYNGQEAPPVAEVMQLAMRKMIASRPVLTSAGERLGVTRASGEAQRSPRR